MIKLTPKFKTGFDRASIVLTFVIAAPYGWASARSWRLIGSDRSLDTLAAVLLAMFCFWVLSRAIYWVLEGFINGETKNEQ